jgi:hypothetical protein
VARRVPARRRHRHPGHPDPQAARADVVATPVPRTPAVVGPRPQVAEPDSRAARQAGQLGAGRSGAGPPVVVPSDAANPRVSGANRLRAARQ